MKGRFIAGLLFDCCDCLVLIGDWRIINDMQSSAHQQQQLSQQEFIRRNGYELTPPESFTLPTATNHTSLIKSLFQLFSDDSRQKTIFKPAAPKTCTILDERLAILYHSNKLIVIQYSVVDQRMKVQSRACFLLNEHIRRIVCAYHGHKQYKTQQTQHFAIEYENSSSISLFKVDEFRHVTLTHDLKQNEKVLAMRFTSGNELVVLFRSGRVSGYAIREGKLRKAKNNLKILLEEEQMLKNGEICTVGSGNQARILLFYLVYSRKHQKHQLHLNQYLRDGGGHLLEQATFYDVFQGAALASLEENMLIYSFGQGILIHQGLTVYVLQKHFGKYIRSDVISQLANARRVMLIERGEHVFLCSVGEGEIELWQVVMKDVGCSLQLLDVVQADGALLAGKLIKAWIFVHAKRPEFALIADAGPRQVDFYLTRKLDKLTKLTGRVRKHESKYQITKKEQKSAFIARLRQMEELGGKLGFKRRQFYLKLWHDSSKNSTHIIEFLLACKDFKVIFNELCLFLRVKKLTVTETIRILKRIEQSLLEQLTHSLQLQLLRQFLKTNFQRRKLKLYSGEIQLDFQQYQDIYEASLFDLIQRSIDLRLFPQKFKHDIVWKEQVQEKPIEIPYILREFRLIILEDYPGFLLKLLQPYGTHLREVIQAYPYLLPQFPLKISVVREELVMLSNLYETEKIEEQQYSWLGYIRQNQWQREASSLDFMNRHLFSHHSTSLIADKLRQFTQGPWCNRNKYSRHILLQANRQQFEGKLPAISDGSSLLFLCERANRLALQLGCGSESEAIMELMHRYNHLPLPQYYRYRLYCTLHHILIREKLLHQTTSIMELMQLTPEKLVACFFLGDRERIELLFQVIAEHYPSRAAFNSIVEAFVGSEECSKVELEMLTNYLRRSGEHYQQNNQQLIAIVLRGFLKRIQIREKDKAVDFLNLFRTITLSEPLLITLALFQGIKAECWTMLKAFQLTSFTYETLINDPATVITAITHEFFSNNSIRNRSIYIEGREVSLTYPQNLFVIILYLKDKVYSFSDEMEIYMIFCEAILGWNQFQLLQKCFNDDILIDDHEYLPEEFYSIVVDYMLERYYEDETLLYCEQTREHITRLLSLIDANSQTAVVERAKMEFVSLLEPLGRAVSVQYMQIIRQQWEKEQQRRDLFHDIIDLYPEIDFQVAIGLYESLERIRIGAAHVTVKTDEFVGFALYICRKYVEAGKYALICDVISFLNTGEHTYLAKYSFMVECFLQVLNDRLQSPHHLRHSFVKVQKLAELTVCKEHIDYFLSHFDHPPTITAFFSDKFERTEGDTSDEIEVDPLLCFTPAIRHISRSEIWHLITSAISGNDACNKNKASPSPSHLNKQKNARSSSNSALDTKTILFTYYFICNILHSCSYLFELDQISFSHTDCVAILEILARQDSLRTALNFKKLFREYLKGLFKIYYLLSEQPTAPLDDLPVLQRRMSQVLDAKIAEIKRMEDSKLILLISDLPLDKGNMDILRAMKKLIPLFQGAYTPLEERSQRIPTLKTVLEHEEHSLPLYFEAERELKQSVTQMALGNPNFNHSSQPKTFRFLEFQRMKKQIASRSNIISEKLIIGKVLDQLQNMQLQEQPSQSFIHEKLTINRLMPEQKESIDEIDIGTVLEDLNLEKSNELIAIDLSAIVDQDYDQTEIDQIRTLLEGREFEKIVGTYSTKTILKAIDVQFYHRLQAAASRPKKRINRSNTLKESILTSRLILLLQALDGLKLYGNTSKIRILRSCLTTISSQELQSVQACLLGIFKLNVLLDITKNTPLLSKNIIDNSKTTCSSIELNRYQIIVKVIDSFIRKCREEANFTHAKPHPPLHEAAELYYEYLCRLSSSSRSDEQKQKQLEQIMIILGKEELLAIHQKLLPVLCEGEAELYLPYLEFIHKLYVA